MAAKAGKWRFLKDKYPHIHLEGDYKEQVRALHAELNKLESQELNRRLTELLNQWDKVNEQLKTLNEEIAGIEYTIYHRLEDSGKESEKFSDGVKLTLSADISAVITDKEAMLKWFFKHDPGTLSVNASTLSSIAKDVVSGTGEREVLPDGVDVYFREKLSRSGGAKGEQNSDN